MDASLMKPEYVMLMQYDGMVHDFELLNGLAEMPTVPSLFVHTAALEQSLQARITAMSNRFPNHWLKVVSSSSIGRRIFG